MLTRPRIAQGSAGAPAGEPGHRVDDHFVTSRASIRIHRTRHQGASGDVKDAYQCIELPEQHYSNSSGEPGYRVEDWTWEARRVRSTVRRA